MGKTNLSNDEKDSIAHFLLVNSEKGVPFKGKISEAARKWDVTRKTISVWWSREKLKVADGEMIHLPSARVGNTNSRRVYIDKEKMKNLPVKHRSSIDKLAKKLGVGYGTVQRWVKQKKIRKHTNAIKPSLTDSNKLQRLIFSLSSIFVERNSGVVKFKDMSLKIHIDEKWFYITKTTDSFYILEEEEPPYRSCQSKRFITKVMFMCAVCRPLYGDNGELIFDGKLGIFPFIEEVPAARTSKNRQAGTLETKPTTSVTKQVIKDCLINKIIPAIKAKWPENASKDIWIQQDNARPHISDNDPDFRVAANSDVATTTVLELVGAVEDAFVQHVHKKLNFNFLTLQTVIIEIMKCKGHNNFSIPHMRKRVLERLGILPRDLIVEEDLVKECLTYLDEQGQGVVLPHLRGEMQQLISGGVLGEVAVLEA
ncbi:uncharacterized protein LOC141632512 [Silene latifolia]|uniref:uncharacterized protein LOC141632512 n=1 Tax=Silene latifolia TaxID=37657 RepID=UPI003D788B4E